MRKGSSQMTVQTPDNQRNRRRRWHRLLFTGLVVTLLVGVAAIWITSLGSVVAGVLSIAFTLLGLLIAFLQWRPRPQFAAQAGEPPVNEHSQQFYEQLLISR